MTVSVRSLLMFGTAIVTAALLWQPAFAAVKDAQATRMGNEIEIRWSAQGPLNVTVADRANAAADARKVVSKADADGVHRMAVATGQRQYYFLETASGDGVWTAERVLPLEGGSNFRDLGGYETADGKRVKWGMLYRSGAMGKLTPADYEYLSHLGIKVLCDLRSVEERELTPTNWKAGDLTRKITIDYPAAPLFGPLMEDPKGVDAAVARQAGSSYGQMPVFLRDHFRVMFDSLVAGEAPLSVNCSAGQDRTGVAYALILSALNVPRETILADYHLSTKYRKPLNEWAAPSTAEMAERNVVARFQQKMMADASGGKALFEPRPLYNAEGRALLEEIFTTLERDYGSVLGYLDKELGIDTADVARLRALYLE
ncbi:MAG: tyrosine-protein phosphatase [Rhodospirillaceae bacterium]|nr:tyrosine-protein phosphatase [Rhodospirillaceae bacterium]